MDPVDRGRAGTNLRAALSLFAARSVGAVVQERDGVLLVASSARVTGPFHAAALRVAPGLPAHRVLDAASRFAAAHRRDVTTWAAQDLDGDLVEALAGAGLPERPAVLGMSRSLPPALPDGDGTGPDGVRVDRVTTAAGVAAFAEVHRRNVTAGGRPPDAVDHYATPGALTGPDVDAFVASAGGHPLAAAMALTTGSVAGIYWVATCPGHRRRGLGREVTLAAARAGAARGADLLVLQATGMGEPLYGALGFVPFARYRRWLVTPDGAAPGTGRGA